MVTPLGLDADLLNACVSCGLCLPHCPTYRATSEESASPRGRIALMRTVESGGLEVDDEFVSFMERCVMCRGCETSCPSGVHFGELMEGTRAALSTRGDLQPPAWLTPSLRMLKHHRLLLAGSSMLGLLQRARVLPDGLRRRFGLPAHLPIRRPALRADAGVANVWLYPGCVMDAWQRDVHVAAAKVIRATGTKVGLPSSGGACCGALHVHAGLSAPARLLAESVMASMPGDAPVLVDSAGCGAQMKDYGHLLGTDAARAFSARVLDVHEWLAMRMSLLPAGPAGRPRERVAVQDPCHLRHVQRAHQHVRTLLAPYVDVVELADDGRCCGAGGSYSVTQPELAGEIRSQKVAVIAATGCTIVASANPGCSMWLADAMPGVELVHPVQLVAKALGL